jgi:hypothetical protein
MAFALEGDSNAETDRLGILWLKRIHCDGETSFRLRGWSFGTTFTFLTVKSQNCKSEGGSEERECVCARARERKIEIIYLRKSVHLRTISTGLKSSLGLETKASI